MKNRLQTILITFFTVMVFTMPTQLVAKTIPLNELIGQFDEKKHADFIALDSTILPVNKKGMYLQQEPTEQLIKAYQDFKKIHPNIPFVIVSAARNYQYQNGIWQRKWQALFPKFKDENQTAKEILQYSSMPGTSRHHWGTEVDITNLNSSYFQADPKGKILYQWLVENMPKYGFCQAFTTGRTGGYQPEEWHWSYQPIAKDYIQTYKNYMTEQPELVIKKINVIDASKLDINAIINEYVFDVNSDCY